MDSWAALPRAGAAVLVEDSPWAYLARHAHHLHTTKQADLRATLSPLHLPTLTIILHSSGRAVGRRHPSFRSNPDGWAPTALLQMQYLQLHMEPCFHVDATCEPPTLALRVLRLLAHRVFHVQAAAFEGMDHLGTSPAALPLHAAHAFAAALPLPQYDAAASGLPKLQRLAHIC